MVKELRLPDQLQDYPPPTEVEFMHEYVIRTKEHLEKVYDKLRWL